MYIMISVKDTEYVCGVYYAQVNVYRSSVCFFL